MKRPDLNTLACVNAECQWFRHAGASNLVIRKVYGRDRIRLLRCRTCGEEFSERRGTALFNTKLPEAKAEEVINHLGEGCSVRATGRLVQVAKETVARLLRVAGRHAERCHDQHVHGLTPKALEFDEQWSFVKKSRSGARRTRRMRLATCGTIRQSLRTASWLSLWWWANGRKSRPMPWYKTPNVGSVPGTYQRSLRMRMPGMSRPSWRPSAIATLSPDMGKGGAHLGHSCAGRKGWPMAK
jgi:transposase-like protein